MYKRRVVLMGKASTEEARGLFIFFLLVTCLLVPGFSVAEVLPGQEEAAHLIPLPELSEPGVPLTSFISGDTGATVDPRVESIQKALKELKSSATRQAGRKIAIKSRAAATAKTAQQAPQSATWNELRLRRKQAPPTAESISAARAVSLPRTSSDSTAAQSG
jgi:hypothetical protein